MIWIVLECIEALGDPIWLRRAERSDLGYLLFRGGDILCTFLEVDK